MNGEELYEKYAAFHADVNNCEVDSWNDLDSTEQAAWNYIATITSK